MDNNNPINGSINPATNPADNPANNTPNNPFPPNNPTQPSVTPPSIYPDPLPNNTPPIAQSITSEVKAPKKINIKAIIVIIILIISIGVAAFFIIGHLNSQITTARFEEVMSKMDGYTRTNNSTFSFEDENEKFTTYVKGEDKSVYGVVMFDELKSKDKLEELASQIIENISDENLDMFSSFDWSKDYNKASKCDEKQTPVCAYVTQKNTTLLLIVFAGESTDAIKAEAEKIQNALGY